MRVVKLYLKITVYSNINAKCKKEFYFHMKLSSYTLRVKVSLSMVILS